MSPMRQMPAVIAVLIGTLVTPGWSAGKPAQSASRPLSVNEVAAKPDAYLGKVAVKGRVAAITRGRGFTLLDSANCSTCTTQCLTDRSTKKIPVAWSGTAPAVKDVVLVQGTISRTAGGFAFTALSVKKQ